MSDGIVGAIAISLFGGEKKLLRSTSSASVGADCIDSGYSMLGTDLDVCRMFDQYAYKLPEKVEDINEQCKKNGYPLGACFNDNYFEQELDCGALCCADERRRMHCSNTTVRAGTRCSFADRNKVCLMNECTSVEHRQVPWQRMTRGRVVCKPNEFLEG